MSSIVLDQLTFDAKSGDRLKNVSLELTSPQVVAFCSNDDSTLVALKQLLNAQGNIEEGTVTVNGEPLGKINHRRGNPMVAHFDDVELKGKTVLKAVKNHLKHRKNVLTVEQTNQMLESLGIVPGTRVAELTPDEQQKLRIILLLSLCRPIVLLDNALDDLDENSRLTIGKLVTDYTKKTDSLVVFTSQDVSTLMRFSKTIYYFEGSHLTSARNVEMVDSVDCVVTVIGTDFPVENAVKLGAHMLEEAPKETRFLFTGNIQVLLPLLEQSTITDVRIEDATVEDELMTW
ncbi:multidrug ABC transporter ATPase [Limosilactobacillus fastidiosus]|uniref:Multidrug ABC transporter ATPase n=1 Tax=Limosilactobacillus fastidiosus TaxID=2759855 RepID=A0ABR6E673_9LACO|nr:multidrug ABC transporter ATPase [Limosilactobacillus fastidiosus]MBB1062693.1 multidrug ABC transporter ATPase [Limosilactobacillus fastidiosus]MCD7083937.1 multidrug ABC transporter ATPase [Limosilactobacillus fastidiosus]